MKRYVVFFFTLLTAAGSACAFEVGDPFFRDYIGLTKALRASGIEPARVDWMPIESMCLGLKGEQEQVTYNRCRFEKATDQAAYDDNRRDCIAMDRGMDERRPPVYAANYNPQYWPGHERHGSYVACMREFGWNNPSNWQQGRARTTIASIGQ